MYRYETHAHTSEGSRCAKSSARELISMYKSLGYSGVFITEHFFNGNVNVPRELPWEERVTQFCHGYEEAKKIGDELGISVFFGWEYSYGWCHILTYGLDKQWLFAHPDVCDWDVEDYFKRVRQDGGFLVHAHSFREGVSHIHLFPEAVDAIEVLNTSRIPESNERADLYAQMYRLPKTAGSDIHSIRQPRIGYVESETPFRCVSDYPRSLLAGELKYGEIENTTLSTISETSS